MSKLSEPEVIFASKAISSCGPRRKLRGGRFGDNGVKRRRPAARGTAAKRASEEEKEKEEEGGSDRRCTSAQPIGSTEGTVATRRQPDRSCLSG